MGPRDIGEVLGHQGGRGLRCEARSPSHARTPCPGVGRYQLRGVVDEVRGFSRRTESSARSPAVSTRDDR
ncbi:hypothetical protein QJS66_05690 [Kocuria rhizophila]|nr:hypothetical protein QJS66_05690 [Kocuria rhizophila]